MSRRIMLLGLMFILVLSMCPSVQPAVAQDDGTPITEEPLQPEAEDLTTPDATPNSIAREIDDGPGTNDPLEVGRIDITAYQCLQYGFQLPEEVAEFDVSDPGTGDDGVVGELPDEVYVEEEFAGCTPDYAGATFEIAVRGNQIRSQTAVSSGYPAVASFPGAFPEPLYIMSSTPSNFRRDPVVICTSSINGPMRFEGAASDYGIVQYDLAVNETLTCAWYFIQLQVPGTIAITTRWCPNDGLYPDNRAALEAACTDYLERISISASLQGGQQGVPRQVEPDGTLRFENISPGTWVLTQASLGVFDEPSIFCRSSVAGQPGVNRWYPQVTYGSPANSITIEVSPDATVACQWFVSKNGFIRFDEGNTILGMRFQACPDGFDPATSTIYDFAGTCHDLLPPVTATIAQPSGAMMTATGDSTEFNFLEFDFIAGAPVTVTVDAIDGYARVIPFCDPRLDGIPGNGPMNPLPVSGGDANVFTVPLLPDTTDTTVADCTVYYILPELGDDVLAPTAVGVESAIAPTGGIVITVHGCPLGTGTDAPDLAADCVDAISGVAFTAISTVDQQLTAASAGDVIASAGFEELPAGTWTISQADVDGYDETVVVCGDVLTVASEGSATVTVLPGETTVCDWYLLPGSRLQGN